MHFSLDAKLLIIIFAFEMIMIWCQSMSKIKSVTLLFHPISILDFKKTNQKFQVQAMLYFSNSNSYVVNWQHLHIAMEDVSINESIIKIMFRWKGQLLFEYLVGIFYL